MFDDFDTQVQSDELVSEWFDEKERIIEAFLKETFNDGYIT